MSVYMYMYMYMYNVCVHTVSILYIYVHVPYPHKIGPMGSAPYMYIEPKVGGGLIFHSGPSFVRVQYYKNA